MQRNECTALLLSSMDNPHDIEAQIPTVLSHLPPTSLATTYKIPSAPNAATTSLSTRSNHSS